MIAGFSFCTLGWGHSQNALLDSTTTLSCPKPLILTMPTQHEALQEIHWCISWVCYHKEEYVYVLLFCFDGGHYKNACTAGPFAHMEGIMKSPFV
jgi:hypothetical protein